ncbi:MAG TPA: hypothetical protein VGL35_12520 [Rhizomicrobium sp.]
MSRTSLANRAEDQADMFGPAVQAVYRPDPDKVRRRLDGILAEARETRALPWDGLSLYRAVVPRLTDYLAEDESTAYRSAFEAELKRLGAA